MDKPDLKVSVHELVYSLFLLGKMNELLVNDAGCGGCMLLSVRTERISHSVLARFTERTIEL